MLSIFNFAGMVKTGQARPVRFLHLSFDYDWEIKPGQECFHAAHDLPDRQHAPRCQLPHASAQKLYHANLSLRINGRLRFDMDLHPSTHRAASISKTPEGAADLLSASRLNLTTSHPGVFPARRIPRPAHRKPGCAHRSTEN